MKSPMMDKTLYRIPEQGMIKGVCAGLADYFGISVMLLRVLTVLLSLFSGLFIFTLALYIALAIFLPVRHEATYQHDDTVSADHQLREVAQTLDECEQRLRCVERYVTSETFGIRSRFRDL